MKKQNRLFISGRVQGVFYRASAQAQAQRLNLSGFAKNLPDGRVEIVVHGDGNALEMFADWCLQGPPNAEVSDVQLAEEPLLDLTKGFEIRH